MNAIEILGSLLGGSSEDSGKGEKSLRDILTGGSTQPDPERKPATAGREPTESDIARQARELEDLLQVSRRGSTPPAPSAPPKQEAPTQWPGGSILDDTPPPPPAPKQEEDATHLIRAMINAGRADGRLDRDEEQKMLQQIGQPTPEVVAFIRREYAKPLDVREFAWSVPLGLELKTYAISLAVLRVDTEEESQYLKDLARGLRLAPDQIAQLHQRYGTRA